MPVDLPLGDPHPKQREFFLARERFVAYGGARAGGKSWAVRKKALLLAVRYPGIRLLLLRRTYPELRENHILPLQADLRGLAAYHDTEKAFRFVNGSRLKMGYCDHDSDVLQYQGQEYDVIFLDEATQFSEYQFGSLTACVRGTNDFPKRMYLTCNPGGVGHAWVKRLFVDRDYRESERPEDYRFIPATVYDNPAFTQKMPDYVRTLENLPENQKKAWLYGDWDIFEGQYFSMWRRNLHVIRPFELPADWRRYVTLDYGWDMLAAYWIALDGRGRATVYRELYESGLLASQAAAKILEMSRGERIYQFLAPPDLWNRHSDTGKSTAEWFGEAGIRLLRTNNQRVQGWYDLAEWLQPLPGGEGGLTPSLRVFENCPNLIRTLPALRFDPHNPNDVATEPHELTHAPDAIRYFVAGRPRPGQPTLSDYGEDRPNYDRQLQDFLGFAGRY